MTQVAMQGAGQAGPAPARAADPVLEDPRDSGRLGALLAGVLIGGSVLAAFAGLARLVLYGFPLLCLVVAVRLLLQRRHCSYLAFSLAVWLSEAGLRRVVDWKTTFHATSPVLIAGALVSLASLPWSLPSRREAYRDVRVVMLVSGIALLFATGVGILRTSPLQTAADFAQIGPGVATGLFVLTVPQDDHRLRTVLRETALWGSLLIGAYAVVQFLVLPPWDAKWITDSGITSVGRPEAGAFRAFSTLTTAGPLGYVIAVLLVLLIADRRGLLQGVAAAFGLVALGIALIRGGWIGFVIGLVVLLALGKGRAARVAAVVAVLAVVALAVPSPIQTAVLDRAQKTTSAGSDDTSLRVRVQFQTQIAPQTLSDPIGDGLGSSGGATDLGTQQVSNIRIRNFDSGIFESLFRYGSVAGLALLGSIVWCCLRCLRRARYSDALGAAAAAGLFALTCGLLLTDTLRGVYGVVFYLLLGIVGRPPRVEVPDPQPRTT